MIFSVIAPFLPTEALQRGVPTWTIGVMFAVLPITMLLASPFSGWVCTKWGVRVGIVSGTLIMALGVGAMGVLQLLDGNAFVVVGVALRAVQGFGAALADTGGKCCPCGLGRVQYVAGCPSIRGGHAVGALLVLCACSPLHRPIPLVTLCHSLPTHRPEVWRPHGNDHGLHGNR